MQRVALITGFLGQDGSLLRKFLLKNGYEVHGIVSCGTSIRPNSLFNIHYADLADGSNLCKLLDEIQPDEVYNLAAQSHVPLSFKMPVHTGNVTGIGTLRLLEAIRTHQSHTGRFVRFFQASSSEMFGRATESPQTETTPFHPLNPYACAKVFAHYQTINYREAYGLFACNGILFNHESPRRGETFLTRKITRAATRIKLGLQERVSLGNLDARRDWGFAGDFVEAMWLILSQDEPDDYVLATGETHSVRDFVKEVFDTLDLDWEAHVHIDPRFFRPLEMDVLCGDATKARRQLDWKPKVNFRQLVQMMTDHDYELAKQEKQAAEFQ